MSTLIVEDEFVSNLLSAKEAGDMSSLKNLIVIGKVTDEIQKFASDNGIKILTFQEVIDAGKANGPIEPVVPTPEDVYMIGYTSGTTGVPKGVKYTHKMVINAVQAMNSRIMEENNGGLSPSDSYLSYFPLCTAAEQCLLGGSLVYGMQCGLFSGALASLTKDLQTLCPTVMFAIPSFYNRYYTNIQRRFKEEFGMAKMLIQ